jgi:hypothetical protein
MFGIAGVKQKTAWLFVRIKHFGGQMMAHFMSKREAHRYLVMGGVDANKWTFSSRSFFYIKAHESEALRR